MSEGISKLLVLGLLILGNSDVELTEFVDSVVTFGTQRHQVCVRSRRVLLLP